MTDFHGDEAKNLLFSFFLKKIFQNGRLKIANSQIFFVKISWIGPWVSRIATMHIVNFPSMRAPISCKHTRISLY